MKLLDWDDIIFRILIFFLFWLVVFACGVYADPIRIAIIDTGYDSKYQQPGDSTPKFCSSGSYDFLSKTNQINATAPHGTIITEIIVGELKSVDYCIMEYQVSLDKDEFNTNSKVLVHAVVIAALDGAQAINISMAGGISSPEEFAALKYASALEIKIFVAAGNDSKDLTKICNSYPACYKDKNIFPVEAIDKFKNRCVVSNYGSRIRETGYGEISWRGVKQCATSFATPRALSRYVLSLHK
jgi:subtilisin family serine protease